MGVTLSEGGVTLRGDMLFATKTLFSQRAEHSPVWFGTSPKHRIRGGRTSILRVRCEEAMRGCASCVPLPPVAVARRTRGLLVEGATLFSCRWCAPGREKGDRENDTFTLPSKGGRSLDSDPLPESNGAPRLPVE